MSSQKHHVSPQGLSGPSNDATGARASQASMFLRKVCPWLPPCTRRKVQGILLIPSDPSATGEFQLSKSISSPMAQYPPQNFPQYRNDQNFGHHQPVWSGPSPPYPHSSPFSYQGNPWAPQTNLSQTQFIYNRPHEVSIDEGYMRIIGGEVRTIIHGAETFLPPRKFVEMSPDERKAILEASYYHPPPPPPPPINIPDPAAPKTDLASPKTIHSTPELAPTLPASDPASDPAAEPVEKPKCPVCDIKPALYCHEGLKLCHACLWGSHSLTTQHEVARAAQASG